MEPEEVVFRVLLFKLFNKIETWQLLTAAVGPLTWKTFNLKTYGAVLDEAKARKVKIFTAAYMQQPQTGFDLDAEGKEVKGKHNRHLALLEAMMRCGTEMLQRARTYWDAYLVFRNFPSPAIGPFAAMQLVTDINYSPVIDFSEDSFIVPGPGAFAGINKCFSGLDLKETNPRDLRLGADVIQDCVAKQEDYFKANGLKPVTLFGRGLTAIDCQNLFCEVDKYCRRALPELNQGRTKIKQTFKQTGPLPKPFFPPKWGLDTSKIPDGVL
jgi:hypothetical protein